jgi:uncharacterized peroxidase-related enzyme
MPRITPEDESVTSSEYKELLEASKDAMGFQSNDVLTLARVPGLIQGLSLTTKSIYGTDGLITNHLKRLISIVTSSVSGSTYCQAHTVHGAEKAGIEAQKIAAVWNYENSSLFSDSERTALRIAEAAGVSPVEVTDEQFDNLKMHFDDNQVCEIIAVICLFGFLNKWNAIMLTDIEANPLKALKRIKEMNPDN